MQPARQPTGNAVGEGLHVVGGRDEHPGILAEAGGDIGDLLILVRMQKIPAVGLQRILIQFLVTGEPEEFSLLDMQQEQVVPGFTGQKRMLVTNLSTDVLYNRQDHLRLLPVQLMISQWVLYLLRHLQVATQHLLQK